MTLDNMEPEEQSFAFHRRLKQEIEIWLRENLITPEQRDRILARYELLKQAEEKAGPGKLVTTITILGSILIGVGVILFIAANWSEIPRWGKLGIIFSSMSVGYGLGFYLRYERGNYPKVGASLILLGSFIFGAGIFLIAQIYHITVHYPNGPLLWGLGVLPLAYLLGFRTILTLAVIDLLIWLGMETNLRIAWVYGSPIVFVILYFMTGISLWSIGLMHRGYDPLRKLASPYIVLGLLVTFSAGYILTFDVFKETFGSETLIMFYSGIIGLFLIAAFFYSLSREKMKGWVPELLGLIFLMALSVMLTLFHIFGIGQRQGSSYDNTANVLTITSNIIFAFGIIGLIVLGYMRRCSAYINIGLLFFVLDVVARYFDFFWKLLPRSIFFIIGGIVLLLAGVILEKKRRKILASFNLKEEN
jgi:uncharacterized membrane protein